MTPEERLKEIAERKNALRVELSALEAEEIAIMNDGAGIASGDKVISTRKGESPDRVYVVHSVDHLLSFGKRRAEQKPWVSGYLIKKDGSLGVVSKCLFAEWEKVGTTNDLEGR